MFVVLTLCALWLLDIAEGVDALNCFDAAIYFDANTVHRSECWCASPVCRVFEAYSPCFESRKFANKSLVFLLSFFCISATSSQKHSQRAENCLAFACKHALLLLVKHNLHNAELWHRNNLLHDQLRGKTKLRRLLSTDIRCSRSTITD